MKRGRRKSAAASAEDAAMLAARASAANHAGNSHPGEPHEDDLLFFVLARARLLRLFRFGFNAWPLLRPTLLPFLGPAHGDADGANVYWSQNLGTRWFSIDQRTGGNKRDLQLFLVFPQSRQNGP